jgi:hypothetical protein
LWGWCFRACALRLLLNITISRTQSPSPDPWGRPTTNDEARSAKPLWIYPVKRIIPNVSIKIDISTGELDWILADEALQSWMIVGTT